MNVVYEQTSQVNELLKSMRKLTNQKLSIFQVSTTYFSEKYYNLYLLLSEKASGS